MKQLRNVTVNQLSGTDGHAALVAAKAAWTAAVGDEAKAAAANNVRAAMHTCLVQGGYTDEAAHIADTFED